MEVTPSRALVWNSLLGRPQRDRRVGKIKGIRGTYDFPKPSAATLSKSIAAAETRERSDSAALLM